MKTITLVTDSLKYAFRTFADNLQLCIKYVLLSFGATVLIMVALFAAFFLIMPLFPPLAPVIPLLAFFVPSFYITLCFIQMAKLLYNKQQITNFRQVIVHWKPFLKGIIALHLYYLIVLLGFICFIIPGIYLASRFYYTIYCIMIDDVGIIESFSCSKRLTANLPWHGALLLCCATILGGTWFLLPVAAFMNVYAYQQCKNNTVF